MYTLSDYIDSNRSAFKNPNFETFFFRKMYDKHTGFYYFTLILSSFHVFYLIGKPVLVFLFQMVTSIHIF